MDSHLSTTHGGIRITIPLSSILGYLLGSARFDLVELQKKSILLFPLRIDDFVFKFRKLCDICGVYDLDLLSDPVDLSLSVSLFLFVTPHTIQI